MIGVIIKGFNLLDVLCVLFFIWVSCIISFRWNGLSLLCLLACLFLNFITCYVYIVQIYRRVNLKMTNLLYSSCGHILINLRSLLINFIYFQKKQRCIYRPSHLHSFICQLFFLSIYFFFFFFLQCYHVLVGHVWKVTSV